MLTICFVGFETCKKTIRAIFLSFGIEPPTNHILTYKLGFKNFSTTGTE